jgi:hypothetical protein
MALNVVLQTDDLTVFGPPSFIDLQVDVGPKGDRGNYIYSASGNPNTVTAPFLNNPPEIGDLYFRTSNNTIYQYLAVPGGEQWEIISQINPITYNTIVNVNFNSGTGSTLVLLDSFYANAPANLSSESVAVQLTSQTLNPMAISVKSKSITTGSTRSLLLEFISASYEDGIWDDYSGSANINLNLSLV